MLTSLAGVWYYGLPGAAIGSVLTTFGVYILFLRRLSKVMSIPIARLMDWKNLGLILVASVLAAILVRFSFDLLQAPVPVAALVGPVAVLVCYVAMLFVTGYYRTLAEVRREWGVLGA